ncbi:hypothetical protein [Bradyrhizobium sp.]
MSEEQKGWCVHYLQDGDLAKDWKRPPLPSKEEALKHACETRRYHVVTYVEGPGGEIIDAKAVEQWCAEDRR